MSDEPAKVIRFPEGRGRAKMAFLLELYHRAHPELDPDDVDPDQVSSWAIRTGAYRREPIDLQVHLRRELSRYLRTEYTTDPQKREVRKYHAVPYVVQTKDGPRTRYHYFEINSLTDKQMLVSRQLRRRAALRDVLQMDLDFGSWLDNNKHGHRLEPMDWNFNPDVAEAKLPTTYPDQAPPLDEDDEDDF
jgi:hypothetical protein